MVPRLPKLYICLLLLAALFAAVSMRAGDDTARFYGTWQAIFPFNGQMVTMRTTHDENGYSNVIVTNMGSSPPATGHFKRQMGSTRRARHFQTMRAFTTSLEMTRWSA